MLVSPLQVKKVTTFYNLGGFNTFERSIQNGKHPGTKYLRYKSTTKYLIRCFYWG